MGSCFYRGRGSIRPPRAESREAMFFLIAGIQPKTVEMDKQPRMCPSCDIYNHLDYYHDIRGIQEICERKDMKFTIAKYLELYTRTDHRPRRKGRKKDSKP